MPELPEVERYRQLAAARALDRRVVDVVADDAWYLKRGLDRSTAADALVGVDFVEARRIGKLLLLDTNDGPTLGLRFGMSGRLLVDGQVGVDDLLYTSNRNDEMWDRFVVRFDDGGDLRMQDPRRLGGVELDPDESRLGIDATEITVAQLRAVLGASRAPLKARLMNQAFIAGVGNLIADETLWRAGLDPRRAARDLDDREVRRLHKHLVRTVSDLIERGGSHQGDFLPHRSIGGRCPRDRSPLERATVGGRTTWWCPKHQR